MHLDLAAFDHLGTVPGTLDIDFQPGPEGLENLVDGELGAFVFDSLGFWRRNGRPYFHRHLKAGVNSPPIFMVI